MFNHSCRACRLTEKRLPQKLIMLHVSISLLNNRYTQSNHGIPKCGLGMHHCSYCECERYTEEFSRKQLKKRKKFRKCRYCVNSLISCRKWGIGDEQEEELEVEVDRLNGYIDDCNDLG